jgi:hypothetical protein
MSVATLKRLIGIEYSYKLELQNWFGTVLADELLVGWSSGANTPAARTALYDKFVACGPSMGFSAKQFAYGILELVIDALVNNVDVPTDPYVNTLNDQLVNVTRFVGLEGEGDFSFMVAVYELSVTLDSVFTNVASVNNAPVGTSKTITIDEDETYTFTVADFGFTDPLDNPPNTLLAVKITTLPALGALELDGIAVTAGDFVPAGDVGLLEYTPALGEFGAPYTTFTFQVQDDGGTAGGGVDLDPTPRTITFNVNEVIV